MFGWLSPRPPLDLLEKAWVETRLLTLARHLGPARMLAAAVVTPTLEFFGGQWDGTEADVQRLLQRLVNLMRVTAPGWALQVCGDDHACAGGESCGPQTIRIAAHQLSHPDTVAAVLAHELAYALLPPAARAGRDRRENEWLADLLPVYLGLGVFMANAVLEESSDPAGPARRPTPRRQSWLPARMVGYALALLTWVRGETASPWRSALRLDAQAAYTSGLRYLERTSDSVFSHDTASRPPAPVPTPELVRQLATGSPSGRIVALWELRAPQHAAEGAPAVGKCLHDRRPAIRQEAAYTLGSYGEHAGQAIPPLLDLLQDDQYAVRCAAATALGALGRDSDAVLPRLVELLGDPDRAVVSSAALAVQNFGVQGQPATPALLSALKAALIRCDHSLTDVLSRALFAVEPDPTHQVLEFFADDYELREQLVHVLVDAVPPLDEPPVA